MADLTQFDLGSSRRIARVVRHVEQQRPPAKPLLFDAVHVGSRSGGRLRTGKVSSAWLVGTCATVTLWERAGTNCLPTAKIPSETVENVVNLSHNVRAGSWVVIAQAADGLWYLVEAGEGTDGGGSCRKTIGGEDITKWSGWNGTKAQLLGHDASGCLKWYDVVECPEPSPGGGGQ